MPIQRINSDKLYSNPSVHHLAIDGNTVYISSMEALDGNWNLVGRGDPEAQAEQVI